MPTSEIIGQSIPDDLMSILHEFVPERRWPKISLDARLLHDLLINGDEIFSLWHRFDPSQQIDMTGFNVEEFFSSETSWDALLVWLLSYLELEKVITKKYKAFLVRDLLLLKQEKIWSSIVAKRVGRIGEA